jgi:hypothetical protein
LIKEITNLLAVIFAIQYVTTITPASSLGLSRISLYFGTVCLLAVFAVISNIYLVSLVSFDKSLQEEMPKWVFL